MLDPSQFQQWCQRLQLPPTTCDLITRLRTAPPARHVQSRAHNVSGRYPSRKMGATIQFESHTVELWAIYTMEHDPQVLEYLDQPGRRLVLPARGGVCRAAGINLPRALLA